MKLKDKIFARVIIVLIIMALGVAASAKAPKTLPKETAAEFGDLYIYYNGRICPLQTFAKDFTVKLYGKPTYKGLTPEQVLTGWMFFNSDWKTEKMIKIKKGAVNQALGTDEKYISLEDFRGNHNEYLLENQVDMIKKGSFQGEKKSIKYADEKFNLIASLFAMKQLKIFPCEDENNTLKWICPSDNIPENISEDEWLFIRKSMDYIGELVALNDYENLSMTLKKIKEFQKKKCEQFDAHVIPSDFRFKTEKIYNFSAKYNYLAYFTMFFGIIFFAIYCIKNEKANCRAIRVISKSILLILFALLTLLIVMRWIVAGHIPLTSSVETQHFIAWTVLLVTIIISKKFSLQNTSIGLIVSGLMLLVASMSSANPKITPLVPVLSSPLLGFHVAVIMVSYALLAIMFVNGITAILLNIIKKDAKEEVTHLADVSRKMLFPAVGCLTIGIFVGAIWANVSWGTYWSWDPKETWSLITMMIYAIAMHKSMAPSLQKPLNFHIFCVLAFMSVLVTYFGVNYILGGMHSYAA